MSAEAVSGGRRRAGKRRQQPAPSAFRAPHWRWPGALHGATGGARQCQWRALSSAPRAPASRASPRAAGARRLSTARKIRAACQRACMRERGVCPVVGVLPARQAGWRHALRCRFLLGPTQRAIAALPVTHPRWQHWTCAGPARTRARRHGTPFSKRSTRARGHSRGGTGGTGECSQPMQKGCLKSSKS